MSLFVTLTGRVYTVDLREFLGFEKPLRMMYLLSEVPMYIPPLVQIGGPEGAVFEIMMPAAVSDTEARRAIAAALEPLTKQPPPAVITTPATVAADAAATLVEKAPVEEAPK